MLTTITTTTAITTATTTTTTTTTATTTTATTTAGMAAGIVDPAVLCTIGVGLFIVLLIAKRLLSASGNEKAQRLGRYTDIAVNPLMVGFLMIVIVTVAAIL